MTEGLYAELKDTNVNITIVFPGGVGTDIMKNSGVENSRNTDAGEKNLSRLLTPKKAAEIVVKGIENDQYRVLAGKDSKAMDRLYRLNPKRAAELIAKKMNNR